MPKAKSKTRGSNALLSSSPLPRVSIIVCSLNEEKRIENCLLHLLDQDFAGGYEIILADGSSEDRTVPIAQKMGVRVVLEKRRSIAFERQAGARAAQGELLLFTDADSSASKDWVSKMVRSFEQNPRVVFVYGPVYPNDASGLDAALPRVFMPVFLSVFHWLRIDSPIGSNIGIRRSVFGKIGGFDTHLITCEDLDLAKRAKKKGLLKLDLGVPMLVSQRRIKAWGLWKYVSFHLMNGINFHLFGRARRDYEDIR